MFPWSQKAPTLKETKVLGRFPEVSHSREGAEVFTVLVLGGPVERHGHSKESEHLRSSVMFMDHAGHLRQSRSQCYLWFRKKNALLCFLVNQVGGQARLSKGRWFAWLFNSIRLLANWKILNLGLPWKWINKSLRLGWISCYTACYITVLSCLGLVSVVKTVLEKNWERSMIPTCKYL